MHALQILAKESERMSQHPNQKITIETVSQLYK